MSYIFNAAYLLLLLVASPWLVWSAIRDGKYREGYAQKLLGRVPHRESSRKCVWLHAVSVGEVNVIHNIFKRLAKARPNWDYVVSTTTKTGLQLAREKFRDQHVFYCPLDFSWSVKNALHRVRPDLLVLAELELWPNLITEAHRRGTRVAIVNGRLSARSVKGYGRIRWLMARLLRRLDLVAVQTNEYAERFKQLGASPRAVHVTGSTKFDGAETNRFNSRTRELRALAEVDSRDVVFLAGSTTEVLEERLVISVFQTLHREFANLRLILVPRHPIRVGEVEQLLREVGLEWQRRSDLDNLGRDPLAPVLVVDTIGELSAWWGVASVAYVGGGMGQRGGQNMIEPAAYGVPVSFGPRTENFREVVQMLTQQDAAQVVNSEQELRQFVRWCLTESSSARLMGERARNVVLQQTGATDRTVDLLSGLMASDRVQRSAA